MSTTKMRMKRWIRKDSIRNYRIQKHLRVASIADKIKDDSFEMTCTCPMQVNYGAGEVKFSYACGWPLKEMG